MIGLYLSFPICKICMRVLPVFGELSDKKHHIYKAAGTYLL